MTDHVADLLTIHRPPPPAGPARCCAACGAPLPVESPAYHRLCLSCWTWLRLFRAVRIARNHHRRTVQ